MLNDAVFDFVGVGEGGVAVKPNEVGEVVDAGDVAIGGERLDGVFVAVAGERPVEEAFEGGGAKFQGEFAGVAGDGFTGKDGLGVERIAVIGGAKGGGSGEAEEIAEMERDGDLGGEFGARDKIGSVEELVVTMDCAGEGVEGKINRQLAPGSLLHRGKAPFRNTAKVNAVGRAEFQIAAIAEARNVETEAVRIIRQEGGTANFGVDGIAVGIGKGEAKG